MLLELANSLFTVNELDSTFIIQLVVFVVILECIASLFASLGGIRK